MFQLQQIHDISLHFYLCLSNEKRFSYSIWLGLPFVLLYKRSLKTNFSIVLHNFP